VEKNADPVSSKQENDEALSAGGNNVASPVRKTGKTQATPASAQKGSGTEGTPDSGESGSRP
jgi:hypothetical protein